VIEAKLDYLVQASKIKNDEISMVAGERYKILKAQFEKESLEVNQ